MVLLENFIDTERKQILNTYKELHELAEPSWKEEKTSLYVRQKLEGAGFDVQTFQGHYGLIAEIKGESNEVIAIRADMDALLQEIDGVVQANHSCGHDGHSTMVLFTALALAKIKHQHTIRFIFQPAEEKAEGALKMIEEGALDNVKFLCGIHLRPAFEVANGMAAPVILHGSSSCIRGTIKGTPAHAARPEEGNNPIEAAALLVQAFQKINVQTDVPYSIKMTELHCGEASNLIPETARFTVDLRAKSNEAMKLLLEEAKQSIQAIEDRTKTKIVYQQDSYSPAAVKNEHAVKLAEEAIKSVLGEECLVPMCDSPGAEDFHFYTLKRPDMVATMIGLGCGLEPGLHHPNMKFDITALLNGTKILTNLLLEADKQTW
ncbi:amidohydrolase [Robertmurraya sp. GLU-23]